MEMKYVDGHIEKEIDSYGRDDKNFVAQGEITITITLKEYRELVATQANKDLLVSQAEEDKYTRNSENEKLRAENGKLKEELYELKTQLDEYKNSVKENDEEEEE